MAVNIIYSVIWSELILEGLCTKICPIILLNQVHQQLCRHIYVDLSSDLSSPQKIQLYF